MPAVAALRSAFPSAHIGWAIERRWLPLLAAEGDSLSGPRSPQRPLVDQVHVVDTMRWRTSLFTRETVREFRKARRELRDAHYDIAVDFQGTMKSAALSLLSGAPRRLGFTRPREKPATLFYTHSVEAQGKEAGTHIVAQNLFLVRALTNQAPTSAPLELPCDEPSRRRCEAELSRLGFRGFALLSPGAGWSAKQWPPERFGEVARALGQHGLPSLVNYGPGEEAIARAVVAHSQGAATALFASLPELVAFTRRARLFIGGDTGPMHLAAALHVPVVALFGPTDPRRNGPFETEHIVLRSSMSATSYSHRRQTDAGLRAISSAEVIAAAESLLARTGGWR
jgi:heptosyltransferase-1